MSDEISDFIQNGASGNNFPSFRFNTVGDAIKGTVTRRDIREVPDMKDRSVKVKNLVVEVHTDEVVTQEYTNNSGEKVTNTGQDWTVWIKSPSQMLTALADAIKASETPATPGAPAINDRIAIVFTGTEPSKTAGFSAKKVYKVLYKPGAPAAPAVTSVDDLL